MGWNADGTFSRSYDWTDERDAGNNIDATKFDTENDTFATGIESCINKDGKNSPSTDLPMGGNKHTGVGDGSARNHYAALGQIQDGTGVWGGTAGGTATALTITPSPAITAYAAGQTFSFLAASTNTGATTINVNSVGAKNVYSGGAACVGGEIVAGQTYVIVYDGTQFQLANSTILPACSAHRDANQSVPNVTTTAITLNKDLYDPDGLHSTSVNTERITLSRIGLWLVVGTLTSSDTASPNTSIVYIYQNGASVASEDFFGNVVTISQVVYASAITDYVDLRLYNNTGDVANVNPARLSASFLR